MRDLTEDEVENLALKVQNLKRYLLYPETIPQLLLEQSLDETWEKTALKIISHCWRIKGAYWFHEPVNPVKLNIPDYLDVIKKPMDMGTVKKRLNYHYYDTADHFTHDMTLIWRNCYKYNGT